MDTTVSDRGAPERLAVPPGVRVGAALLLGLIVAALAADLLMTGAPPAEVAVAVWLAVSAGMASLVLVRRGSNRVAWLMLLATAVGSAGC